MITEILSIKKFSLLNHWKANQAHFYGLYSLLGITSGIAVMGISWLTGNPVLAAEYEPNRSQPKLDSPLQSLQLLNLSIQQGLFIALNGRINLDRYQAPIYSVKFSPNGKILASGGEDNSVSRAISFPREPKDGKFLRGYWGVENKVHHVRDVTQGEDASRIRMHQLPQVFTVARNFAINLYRSNEFSNMVQAERLCKFGLDTLKAIFRMK